MLFQTVMKTFLKNVKVNREEICKVKTMTTLS